MAWTVYTRARAHGHWGNRFNCSATGRQIIPCICTVCLFFVCAVNGRRSVLIALSERDRDERIMLGCSPPCPQSTHTFVESMRAGSGSHRARIQQKRALCRSFRRWCYGVRAKVASTNAKNRIIWMQRVQFTSECVRKSIYSVNKEQKSTKFRKWTTILGAKADLLWWSVQLVGKSTGWCNLRGLHWANEKIEENHKQYRTRARLKGRKCNFFCYSNG